MLSRHWPNIHTFFAQRLTNAGAESMNSKIQKLNVLARGFRNRDRFRDTIYFHLGGLDLYPEPLARVHNSGPPKPGRAIGVFTANKPIIFNFHGYPWLIHELAYRLPNHDNLHVRGYKETPEP